MNKLITNPIVAGLWICLRKLELPPMTELDGNGCALLPGVLTPAECIEMPASTPMGTISVVI